MRKNFKRYCKTLHLEDNPLLIAEYKRMHARGNSWPEIGQGLKDVGIIDMEIYLTVTTLFKIMDTVENFDHDQAMTKLGSLPRQSEWEAAVSKFQKTGPSSSAKEKWILIERIFKLDQDAEYQMNDGYIEHIME